MAFLRGMSGQDFNEGSKEMIKRCLFAILGLLCFSIPAFGQSTTATGPVVDANSQAWAYGTWRAEFYPSPTNPTGPYFWNGSPYTPVAFSGSLDGSGNFTQAIPSNTSIVPAGSKWRFTFCPGASVTTCASGLVTLSGGTINVASLVTIPGVQVSANTYNQAAAYSDSEIVGATPGFTYYNLISNGLRQCNGPLPCTWTAVGGGGGTPPAPPGAAVQFCTSGTVSCTGLSSVSNSNGFLSVDSLTSPTNFLDPFNFTVGGTSVFFGPNPYIDVASPAFGVRATTSTYGNTGTISATTTSLTLASAYGGQNGDGVVIGGAGATNTSTTPTLTSVTPSQAIIMGTNAVPSTTGSSTAEYEIVGRRKGGGVTAASSPINLTTGLALGQQSATITGWTRSNNTTTYTTSASQTIATGSLVHITGCSDTSANGAFIVATNGNPFTVTSGMDTRNGATTSGGGCTVTWKQENRLTWTYDSTLWQYIVYVSYNSGTSWSVWLAPPGAFWFDDFGFTPPALPWDVPTTPPSTATNDNLVTTVVSGAGTSSLTLAASASNSVTNAPFYFDNTAPMLAAVAAAHATGQITIPASTVSSGCYWFNSILDLSSYTNVNIKQVGPVCLNDTMYLPQNSVYSGTGGQMNGGNVWQYVPSTPLYCYTANPCVRVPIGTSNTVENIQFNQQANNATVVQVDGQAGNFTFNRNDVIDGSSSGNYIGIPLAIYGAQTNNLSLDTFAPSSPSTSWATTAPSILDASQLSASPVNGPGNIRCNPCFFQQRGIASYANGTARGTIYISGYEQAAMSPTVMEAGSGTGSPIEIQQFESDTNSAEPYVNAAGTSATISLDNAGVYSLPSNVLSGNSFAQVVVGQGVGWPSPGILGQNFNVTQYFAPSGCDPPAPFSVYSTAGTTACTVTSINQNVVFPGQQTAYFTNPNAPAAASASVGSGGSLLVGAWVYAATGTPVTGGQSGLGSQQTCTTTSGNQTCTVNVTIPTGYLYWTLYRCYSTTNNCSNLANWSRASGQIAVGTTSYTDNGVGSGPTPPTYNAAALTGMQQSLLFGPELYLEPVTSDYSSPPNGSVWYNSTLGVFRCQQAGTTVNCIGSGSGSGPTIQTNGVNNTSQTVLNFVNPSSFNGLNFTYSNPTGGNETFTVSGTLGNSGLQYPLTTVNSQNCTLGSTCTIPFQSNGTNNTSQAGINFINSVTNAVGLSATFSNPGTNQEKLEITGNSYTGNAATASTLLGCSPSTPGDLCYWNGSAMTRLAGNSGSTQWLQENSSGVPSWTVPSGAGNVSTSGSPAQYQTAVWASSSTITGVGPGTSGYPLVSNGASSNPGFQQLTSAGLNITATSCTNQFINSISTGGVGNCAIVGAAAGGTGISTASSTGVAQVAGGTWSVSTALANGTTATTQTTGDNTTKVATDAFVIANSGNIGTCTQYYIAYWPTTSSLGCFGSAISGQIPIFQNGASPVAASPGIAGSTISASTYSVQCDSSTTLLDRLKVLVFTNTGGTTVTVPDAGSSGCGSNFTFAAAAGQGAGTVTVNRQTSSTFTILTGSSATSGATSFTLTAGQYATVSSPDNANYIVRIVENAGATIETNGAANANQALLNFVNPSSFNGLSFAFSNPSGGNETFGVTGTLGNAGLTNSSVTFNGQTASLGGSATIPFQINSTNLSSQAGLNFINANAFNGLTLSYTNPTGNEIQPSFSGTLGNAGLTNSSITLNGQTVSLGATGNIPFETNGTNNTSLAGLNLQSSSATNGVTLTFTNTSSNNVQLGLSGTLNNAGLTNSSITIAGTSVALGGSTTSFPSPGAIGGTTPAAGTFTTLAANTSFTLNGGTAQTGTQGTDTKLLTASTISGSPGATLCTDANGGATTSGCSSGGSSVIPIQLPVAVCQGSGVSIGGSGASATLPAVACTAGSSTTPQIGQQVYNYSTVGTLYVDYSITLPTSFTAINDLVFTVQNDTATSGTDYMNFQYACVASGSAVQPTYSSVQQASGTVPGTVGYTLKLTLSSPTISGCSANNIMYIRIGAGTGSGVFASGNLDLTNALVELH